MSRKFNILSSSFSILAAVTIQVDAQERSAPYGVCYLYAEKNYQGQRYDVNDGDLVYYSEAKKSQVEEVIAAYGITSYRKFSVPQSKAAAGFKSAKVAPGCMWITAMDQGTYVNSYKIVQDTGDLQLVPGAGEALYGVFCHCFEKKGG